MHANIPEYLREKSVSELFTMATFSNCWPIWKKEILKHIGNEITPNNLIELGDHLSSIFALTGDSGRGQSALSGGGAAWEALVCWYLNLCTAGSRIVAFKKMSVVPAPIQKALTVNYGNFACNTESDITVVVFPSTRDYTKDIGGLRDHFNERSKQKTKTAKTLAYKDIIDKLCEDDFEKYEVGVVQCKTNWNDNAQIPMLWDMIYSANGFENRNISIGKDSFSMTDLQKFSYSFVTVPSGKRDIYKSDSVSVKRVAGLSGGNYWGRPSQQNVCRSVKEIFNKNFQNGFNKNIRTDLNQAIPLLDSSLKYFRLT